MPDIEHYIGNAELFPILRKWDFFNHAGVSPLPRAVSDALRSYAAQAETDTYLTGTWYRDIERLRVLSARLLNCHRDEIAFVKNTGEGLSIVAQGIEWNPGDRIVTTGVEYPANIYTWMEQSRRRGCELVMIPEETHGEGRRHVPIERILREAEHPRTRLVTLSHVEYASGQRHDLSRIGAACRRHGKLFCVDAIQSVGVLPVDVEAMGIDFLSADGHKWMLGPEGAGIFCCRRERIEMLRPLTIGWMNVINAQDYGHYDYTLKPGGAVRMWHVQCPGPARTQGRGGIAHRRRRRSHRAATSRAHRSLHPTPHCQGVSHPQRASGRAVERHRELRIPLAPTRADRGDAPQGTPCRNRIA